jgi:stage IV sporulation protein A
MVITTDGSITGIPREDYILAEERVVNELKELNKPFVMILNSSNPYSDEVLSLAKSLQEKYETQVIPMSCLNMTEEDLNNIFTKLLYEFIVERINIRLPKWINGLKMDNSLKIELFEKIKNTFKDVKKIVSVQEKYKELLEEPNIKKASISEIDLGSGEIKIDVDLQDNLFYEVLSSTTGVQIRDEEELFSSITQFANIKKEYDKMAYAIHEVYERGYGIVTPGVDDLILEEPEIVKQGQKYGVKLRAKAPSIHMLKIETETEISPIVGSERQSEDLVKYLLSEFETDPKKIWESNIFGKSLHELVNEGLQNKLARMPEDAQEKLRDTIQRIVNEGSGGLICIIL